MLIVLLAIAALAAGHGADELTAMPIPSHKVGENEAVTGVCWSVGAQSTYEHTFVDVTDQSIAFYFENVELARPNDVTLCAGAFCRANRKTGRSFWSVPLGMGNATTVTVRVRGPSTGCITKQAGLNHNGARRGRLDNRNHVIAPACSTDQDDTIPAKCSATGQCNPMPEVYSRAKSVASIMYQKSGSWFVCTAWLSSNTGHIFTNNHCVPDQTTASTIEFYFGCEMGCNNDASICDYSSSATDSSKCHRCDANSAASTLCHSQMQSQASGATLLRTSTTLDYTLLKINSPGAIPCIADVNCPMRLVPSSYRAATPKVFMFHHSAGKPKLLSYFDSPSPGHLTTGRLQIRQVSGGCYARDLTYDADAVGGSSGSVVALAPDYCNPAAGQS
jgi:hypothetical protein